MEEVYRVKIEKVLQNISKGKVYLVTPFMNDIFGVCIGRAFLNVDIMNYTLSIQKVISEDQERSTMSPNFKISRLCIALDIICPVTIWKHARILCLVCIVVILLCFPNCCVMHCHYLGCNYCMEAKHCCKLVTFFKLLSIVLSWSCL